MSPSRFPLDETPLREHVLRTYHERRDRPEPASQILSAIRQFLSGPPGGETIPDIYWFEEDPDFSIADFLTSLESVGAGLASQTFEPLLEAIEEREKLSAKDFVPNLSVYVSSMAGALAVKARLDETLACGLIAAALIGISRLGTTPFRILLPAAGPS